MKILKKELELWNEVREEFNDFYISNTGIGCDKMLLLLYDHKLKELREMRRRK